ncbi:MAG TPA: MaoC/PaaZ C-terminal domain-containing protein [Propionicimonas sp.]
MNGSGVGEGAGERRETGRRETGRRETGRHETGLHETERHETGLHETEHSAVVELGRMPTLGPSYGRAVVGAARSGLGRGAHRSVGPADLLRTTLVVRGIQAEADRLTDYQHLVGEPAGDALPAGFVHVLAFPLATALMVRPGFPLSALGMIHTENRVVQRRGVRLGESLDVRVRAEDLRAHRSGVTVDLVAEVSVGDEQVWVGRSTYLAKGVAWGGAAPAGLASEHGLEAGAESRPDRGLGAGPESRPDHGLGAGAANRPDRGPGAGERREFVPPVPTGQWRLAADVGRRYAAVSGDRNPIHLSPVAAKAFGFPRTSAHGMYTAARALADVGPDRGDAFTWDVEFSAPVLLPSTVMMRVARLGATSGAGFEFVGWDARRGRRHFVGTVSPV